MYQSFWSGRYELPRLCWCLNMLEPSHVEQIPGTRVQGNLPNWHEIQ